MKMYDLTQGTGIQTPPWPTYEPLQVKYFKRLAANGANGQLITTSNHVGTHLDGEIHFWAPGKDIASIPLDDLVGTGVVVDISDMVSDYDIYTGEMIEKKLAKHGLKIQERDILIIVTGFYKYAWERKDADEIRYMCCHPGPMKGFDEWCIKHKIKWIGVDCGSADHPMNTIIRKWQPDLAKKAEKKLGKPLEEIFPPEDYQMMHIKLFPHSIIHVENIGGEIEKVLNRRITIGCFPWKFVGGESAFCRVVAFEF
ncbi:MAG: cyclase family protein [Thermoplasmata archaeon]